MNKYYQNIVTHILKDEDSTSKTFSEIVVDVLELLMKIERELYLEELKNSDNKGNGFYERSVRSLGSKLLLRVPRDRAGSFRPLMLEVIKQDSERLGDLALSMYSRGVSQRDTSAILEEALGVHFSASKVAKMVKELEPHRHKWQQRKLDSQYRAVMIDAIHINVRRDSTVEKEAIYVVMGLKKDFTRELLGIYALPTESATGWGEVLLDLKDRGVQQVPLFICDELSGIENSIYKHFPKSFIQFCLVHKMRQLMTKVRSSLKEQFISEFKQVFNINLEGDTKELLEGRLRAFIAKWEQIYPTIKSKLPEHKWQHYYSYLYIPITVRKMLYTTNWIERLNKEIRKVTRHVNSFPNEDSMLNLVFMVCQNMNQTYKYPITNFYPVKQQMDKLLYTS